MLKSSTLRRTRNTAVNDLPDFDYADFDATLRRCKLGYSPAEVHGMAVGMVSADVGSREEIWQAELLADLDPADALAQPCRKLLVDMIASAEQRLSDEQFGFELLLPDQDSSVADIPAALRDWVQGFLFGVGLAGTQAIARLSEDGREAIHDLSEIGKLDVQDVDLDEEEQAALAELQEYVRVTAMLVYEDSRLSEQNDDQPE